LLPEHTHFLGLTVRSLHVFLLYFNHMNNQLRDALFYTYILLYLCFSLLVFIHYIYTPTNQSWKLLCIQESPCGLVGWFIGRSCSKSCWVTFFNSQCIDNLFVRTKLMFCSTKGWKLPITSFGTVRRLNLLSLAMRICNVWHNTLSRICRSIGCHFKCCVNMLILYQYPWQFTILKYMFHSSVVHIYFQCHIHNGWLVAILDFCHAYDKDVWGYLSHPVTKL